MKQLFYGGTVITPQGLLPGGAVVAVDGVIEAVLPFSPPPEGFDRAVDAGGLYIAPGFVDVHVHGGGGGSFLSGDARDIEQALAAHIGHGTTSLYPTLPAAAQGEYVRALEALQAYQNEGPLGWAVAGVHMEGPYLALAQSGAQPPGALRMPDPAEYGMLAARFPVIRRWSAAPELPGALEMARALAPLGIRMSIAHSDALEGDVRRAFACGYDCVTHLYSGCTTVTRVEAYRHAGTVETALLLDGMTVEIIADGKHLPESLLRLIYRCKGPERICLVTDGISVSGVPTPEGVVYESCLKTDIIVEDGVAKMPDRKSFAGSIATMDRLVCTMLGIGVPLHEAVCMAATTPARANGLSRKGALEQGKDADIILFDDDVAVRAVYQRGRMWRP